MKISVITPSYNQGRFIRETIESVLSQKGDFDLEYIVIDGGSTDGTLEILRDYTNHIVWTSEPDAGQSDAINKGLRRASGDILAWLNSDDLYLPEALQTVATEMKRRPFAWCFGRCRNIDENGREIRHLITRYKTWQCRNYSYRRLLRRLFIPQPATFFTRQAYLETGDVAADLDFTMDYDYWLRLGRKYEPRYVDSYLACFRVHGASKNGTYYRRAAWEAFRTAKKHAPPGSTFDLLLHFMHFCLLVTVYPFL